MQLCVILTVSNGVHALLEDADGHTWSGTARQLLAALQPALTRWPRGQLPPDARALVVALHQVPGIQIVTRRHGKQRTRIITLYRAEASPVHPPFFFPL